MIKSILGFVLRVLLRLRYKIKLHDFEKIKPENGKGILFLPNHPALVDPFIIYTTLMKKFSPRVLIDERQSERPGMKYICKKINALPIPDVSKVGSAGKSKIQGAINEIVKSLKNGEEILLYPAGQVFRKGREDLRGASAVQQILQEYPETRVVLIQTVGLWGSSLSYAPTGKEPNMAKVGRNILISLLTNLIFFMPKREVNITFLEPTDLPRQAPRNELNKYLEDFYNSKQHLNLFYPYHFIHGSKPIEKEEVEVAKIEGDSSKVSPQVREQVFQFLKKLTGVSVIEESQQLARDLNMDSLAKTELVVWLENEFGYPVNHIEALNSVTDVLLVASGEVLAHNHSDTVKPNKKWFKNEANDKKVFIPSGDNIAEVFFKKASENPSKAIVADEKSGVKTYRDLIMAMLIFKPRIEKMEGERVGIMLPASVASVIVYFSTMCAGKVPVMINWTVGSRNIRAALDSANISCVITANALVTKLKSQGASFRGIEQTFIYLEDVAKSISKVEKIKALLTSHISWKSLTSTKIKEHSVILFTSGSESVPKAVPLSHQNQLANIRDILQYVSVYEKDRFVGFLPPFHSFGITITTVMSMLGGIQTVYHANPTDATKIGQIIDLYRATLIPGTPTFLSGIVRASQVEQLKTLRIAVTGAEKCTENVYNLLEQKCSQMKILEGYGITECSPVVSVCPYEMNLKNSIGKVLPSIRYRFIDPDSKEILPETATEGILIVSGPSIFNGYLNYEGESPFLSYEDTSWYNTGDIVQKDDKNCLIFKGRKKRFIKLGGEMISLPAIENILLEAFASENDDGPILAVEATVDENKQEIVLFAVKNFERENINEKIKLGGLSPLHYVRQINVIEKIPVLGTGKTDYKALKEILKGEKSI